MGMELNGVPFSELQWGLIFDTASSEEFALFVNQEIVLVIQHHSV
jgi:hypothetical protein